LIDDVALAADRADGAKRYPPSGLTALRFSKAGIKGVERKEGRRLASI
jgi:hypothetical protein